MREELTNLALARGGPQALYEELRPEDAALLAVRLDETATAAEARLAADRERAQADLEDPAVQRQLAELALQWLAEHPDALQAHLAQLISHRPSTLTKALADALPDPRVKRWLSASGWTIAPPAEDDHQEQPQQD